MAQATNNNAVEVLADFKVSISFQPALASRLFEAVKGKNSALRAEYDQFKKEWEEKRAAEAKPEEVQGEESTDQHHDGQEGAAKDTSKIGRLRFDFPPSYAEFLFEKSKFGELLTTGLNLYAEEYQTLTFNLGYQLTGEKKAAEPTPTENTL